MLKICISIAQIVPFSAIKSPRPTYVCKIHKKSAASMTVTSEHSKRANPRSPNYEMVHPVPFFFGWRWHDRWKYSPVPGSRPRSWMETTGCPQKQQFDLISALTHSMCWYPCSLLILFWVDKTWCPQTVQTPFQVGITCCCCCDALPSGMLARSTHPASTKIGDTKRKQI